MTQPPRDESQTKEKRFDHNVEKCGERRDEVVFEVGEGFQVWEEKVDQVVCF